MYVLIITMILNANVAVTTQEFSSLETCKEAYLVVSDPNMLRYIKAKCVKK